MKIVIVNTHMVDHLGGSQIQCDVIASGLHERGHEIIYLAIDKIKEDYNTDYSVIGVDRDGRDVADKILEIKPDIVYWRFNKRFFYKTIRKIVHTDIKIVFAVSNIKDLQPYGSPILESITFKKIKKYLKQKLSNRFNHIGFKYIDGLTTNNKEHLKYSPVKKKKYIPNAITDEVIDFKWPRPFVVWVANIKKRKRPEKFLELARKFENSGTDFLMIGKISDEDYNWIGKSESNPANFYYLGQKSVKEVNGILSESLFLVTTSTPEGYSNNLIQAWLQGKPTLSYEFDPEDVMQKKNIGVVCNENENEFYSTCNKLINDEGFRYKLGQNAYNYSSNYFSKVKSIDLLESFMEEVYGNA